MAPHPITTPVRGERYSGARKRGEDLTEPPPKARQTKRLVLALLEKEVPGMPVARALGYTPQVVSYYTVTYRS